MMLPENTDILAFAYSDWNASWSTPQQLMSRLAPQHRVLYVDQPRSMFYNLRPRDPQGAGIWNGSRMQEVSDNLFVFHPRHSFLPLGFLPPAIALKNYKINGFILAHLLMRCMKSLGMKNPIIWNFSVLHGGAIIHIPHRLSLYDLCDEWVSYIPQAWGRATASLIEDNLCRQADLVFTGTAFSREKRKHLNPEMHVVAHAADYHLFSKAQLDSTAIANELQNLPRPVIGSIGVLDPARFDTELIVYLAKAHPEWSIVLVGPARSEMDCAPLRRIPNIYLLGNRPIPELPYYLKGMDVTLIPYALNEATMGIYPLKLQEYLAAGKPVVAPPLPALLEYEDVVCLAADHVAFERKIIQSLTEDSAEAIARRQSVAYENSWEKRLETKCEHISRVVRMKEQSVTHGNKESGLNEQS